MNIGQTKLSPLKTISQLGVIQTHQVQYRRMEIVNFNRILYRVVAKIIRSTERHTRLDTASSHPH